jgi:hypothetical protein
MFDFLEKYVQILEKHENVKNELILCDDFNYLRGFDVIDKHSKGMVYYETFLDFIKELKVKNL